MSKKSKNRGAIEALLQERPIAQVEETEWLWLRSALPGISEATLRRRLLELQIPIKQPWRGPDTTSLNTLEQTLQDLADAYAAWPEPARAAVIAAKDKSRFAARNVKADAGKRALKSEMVEWMLVWLDDPRMFADWAGLRRAVLSNLTEPNPAKQTPL